MKNPFHLISIYLLKQQLKINGRSFLPKKNFHPSFKKESQKIFQSKKNIDKTNTILKHEGNLSYSSDKIDRVNHSFKMSVVVQ